MAQRTPAPELPGYTFRKWLGGGGFADVFHYHQEGLGRDVAIKMLHHGVNPKTLAAFQTEASLMAKLSSHPNIVTIFEMDIASDGRPYLVMEMCPAAHLGERVSRRLYSPAKAMEVGVQIAGAVETAHRLGVLHRDIKPANILFTQFSVPALTDFGISISVDQGATASTAMSPLWAPPEQFGNSPVGIGPWSDVYSLAASVWATLVGHSPMYLQGQGNDVLHLNARVRSMPAPRTGRADVPDELERVLAVAMAKDPRERFQSALEFARAMQGVQGLLNQSVTAVQVFTDEADEPGFEPEQRDGGTRIQGFQLIDPEAGEPTSHATGPSGGLTSPLDRSEPTGGYLVPGQGVLQHGRGVAQPGLRDFTGPVAPAPPEEKSAPAATLLPEPESEPSARKRLPRVAVVASLLIVLVGVVVTVVVLVNRNNAATTPNETGSPSASAKPVDPLAAAVPAVTDLSGSVSGSEVTFTWTNPDPQQGDRFRYAVRDPRGGSVSELTSETTVTVAALAGDTCLEVHLVRLNGRESQPATVCAP